MEVYFDILKEPYVFSWTNACVSITVTYFWQLYMCLLV